MALPNSAVVDTTTARYGRFSPVGPASASIATIVRNPPTIISPPTLFSRWMVPRALYSQPLSTSSPHQIGSAAMVVSPLLRGMFGLATDAKAGAVTFAPHLPADWSSLGIDNVRVGENKMQL